MPIYMAARIRVKPSRCLNNLWWFLPLPKEEGAISSGQTFVQALPVKHCHTRFEPRQGQNHPGWLIYTTKWCPAEIGMFSELVLLLLQNSTEFRVQNPWNTAEFRGKIHMEFQKEYQCHFSLQVSVSMSIFIFMLLHSAVEKTWKTLPKF
jgi:hypothetical protein